MVRRMPKKAGGDVARPERVAVRRVQELRRSNAATARPGRRFEGPTKKEWDK